MIIIRNLLELGIEDVANFYRQSLRYTINMGIGSCMIILV